MAAKWLEENNKTNREINRAWVEHLAGEIKTGRWKVSPGLKPITFAASDRRLLDGQNRLAAVVEAGVSVEMLVTFCGEPEDMDAGNAQRPWRPGDYVAYAGFKPARALSATARQMLLGGSVGCGSIRHQAITSCVTRYYDKMQPFLPLYYRPGLGAAVAAAFAKAYIQGLPGIVAAAERLESGLFLNNDQDVMWHLDRSLRRMTGKNTNQVAAKKYQICVSALRYESTGTFNTLLKTPRDGEFKDFLVKL